MPRTGKPKTGRPKNTPDKIKHPIPSYLMPDEYEKLLKISERWNISLSGAIKRLILEKKLEEI